ncbi:MAG TPA: hypothetical protein VLH61_01985 [Bacteroidales bacterium]|nr:hypothetical protein [Bacteroidales bacterium]
MLNEILKYFGYLIALVFVQVSVFNNINFGGYINPYIYIFFIMLLPLQVPGWLLLLSGFGIGMVIDLFSDSQGIHTSATLIMAFARPGLITLLHGRSELPEAIPMISNRGIQWMATYILSLVLIHHAVLFFLEIFGFVEFFQTLARILLSTLISSMVIILGYSLIDRPVRQHH